MEVIDFLKKEIEKIKAKETFKESGEIFHLEEGIAKAVGLENAFFGEIVLIKGKKEVPGVILSLEEDEVGIALLGKPLGIKEGDLVERTKKILSVPVGEELLSRVINPLGKPLDGKGEIKAKTFFPIERIAPSVVEREPVNYPLHTGIKAIDSMIPIGRGQRELILGDRQTGKTSICIDTIINQKNEEKPIFCIYVAIGQKQSKVARIYETLKKHGAMDYTIIVHTSPSDPATLLYIAPYAGCAIGEYFMEKGKDALVIYDDLTKHAWAWREIALLLRRPPGREAYPGDIFYLHSRLLERSAKLSPERGGGSLTALPIIETQEGDIAGYIPTNVISICDGQIYLDRDLFAKGQLPAINIGLSVSRVGSSAQTKAMKKVAPSLRLDLAQFRELEAFVEFAEEVDPETRKKIERGRRLLELLKQDEENPLPFEKEAVVIFAGTSGLLDDLPLEKIKEFEKTFLNYLETQKPEILKKIRETKDFPSELKKELEKAIRETKKLMSL